MKELPSCWSTALLSSIPWFFLLSFITEGALATSSTCSDKNAEVWGSMAPKSGASYGFLCLLDSSQYSGAQLGAHRSPRSNCCANRWTSKKPALDWLPRGKSSQGSLILVTWENLHLCKMHIHFHFSQHHVGTLVENAVSVLEGTCVYFRVWFSSINNHMKLVSSRVHLCHPVLWWQMNKALMRFCLSYGVLEAPGGSSEVRPARCFTVTFCHISDVPCHRNETRKCSDKNLQIWKF